MIEACDAHGVKLFVVHQNRYNLPIVKAREALEQGRFGRLVLGTIRLRWMRDQAYYDSESWRGTWAHDGGVFMNQAVHHIDMLTWFMGSVESVRSMAATRLVKIEGEDTGVAVIRFNSGALGVLEATTAARPKDLEGSISILGEKGSVVIGGFFMNELVTWNFDDKRPVDDVVFEQYGKNPPDLATTLASTCAASSLSIQNRRVGPGRRPRGPKVAGAHHGAVRIHRDQHGRAAPVPAQEVPPGDRVVTTSITSTSNVTLGEGTVVEDFCIVGAPPRGASDGELPTVDRRDAVIRSHTVIYAGNVIGRNFQTGNKVNIRESNRIGDNVSVGNAVGDRAPRGDRRQRAHSHPGLHSGILGPGGGMLDRAQRGASPTPSIRCRPASRISSRARRFEGRQDRRQRHDSPGVVVGENALVGAGSVVVADVPAGRGRRRQPRAIVIRDRQLPY